MRICIGILLEITRPKRLLRYGSDHWFPVCQDTLFPYFTPAEYPLKPMTTLSASGLNGFWGPSLFLFVWVTEAKTLLQP
jgi:hypothetical protein